jgi:hypothetical protein
MIEAAVIVEGVLLILLGILVLSLLRGYAGVLDQLAELRSGSDRAVPAVDLADRTSPLLEGIGEASDIVGTEVGGDAVKISLTERPGRTLLAFLSTGCLACSEFWQALADPEKRRPLGDTRILIVTKSESEESPSAVAELAPAGVQTVMSSGAWESYGIKGSPFFVHIDGPTGQILGAGTATSWSQAIDLLVRSISDRKHRRRVGSPDDESRATAELAAAGIGPSHPSAYGRASAGSTDAGSGR